VARSNRKRTRGRRQSPGTQANRNGAAPNGAVPDDDAQLPDDGAQLPDDDAQLPDDDAQLPDDDARIPQAPGHVNVPDALNALMPDAELAEAQLAIGRPELAEVPSASELEAFEEEQAGHQGRRTSTEVQSHEASRPPLPVRFVGFLRGCWHELQRVQWPDRRQVMQATGVVLGFVVVAGIFLGVADVVASKLVHLILK
jgi:preprotein translocase subunit SecE